MSELLDDLKAIPRVLGACLYHKRKGPVESNFPVPFKADKLGDIGRLLMKIRSAGRMNFDDLSDLSLHYDESVLLARELEDNLLVFVLCDPGFNPNLLTMSLNLLQQEVKNQQLEWTEVISSASKPAAKPQNATEVTKVLDELKSPLTKVLGPMAGFIFDEVVEKWEQQGSGNIDGLLRLVEEEIGDPEKIGKYEQLIAPVLERVSRGG